MFYLGTEHVYSPDDGSIYMNNNKVMSITGIRQRILELLLEQKGSFITRTQLVKEIWGKDDLSIYNASLTQQIYLLRKDLHKIGMGSMIYSNSRQGYKLVDNKMPPGGEQPASRPVAINDAFRRLTTPGNNTVLIISLASISSTIINLLICCYILLSR